MALGSANDDSDKDKLPPKDPPDQDPPKAAPPNAPNWPMSPPGTYPGAIPPKRDADTDPKIDEPDPVDPGTKRGQSPPKPGRHSHPTSTSNDFSVLPEFEDNQTLLGGLAESFSSGKKFWISLRDRVLDFTSFALIEHNRNIARRLFSLVKNVGKKLQITFDGSALRPLKRILRPFGVWLGRYLLALDVLKDTKKVDEEYLVGEGRKRPRWQAFWSIAARALILGARYLGGVAGIEGGKLLIEAWLGRILQRMLFVGLMADLAEGLFIVIIAAGGSYLFGYLARQLGYVINLVFYLTWALLRRLQIRIRPAKRRLKPGVSQTKHPPPKPPYREEIKKRPPWNPLPPPWFPDGGTPDDAYSDDEGGGGPSGSGVPISPTPGPVPTGMHPIPTPNGALPTAVIHNPPVTPAPVPLPHVAPPLPAPNIVLPKPQPLPQI